MKLLDDVKKAGAFNVGGYTSHPTHALQLVFRQPLGLTEAKKLRENLDMFINDEEKRTMTFLVLVDVIPTIDDPKLEKALDDAKDET